MSQFTIQFCPSTRISQSFQKGINQLLEENTRAPAPETPTNSLIFIGLLEKKVIAYASVTIHQKSAKITSIFISPKKQGNFFGFKLVLDIFDKLSKTGCQRIRLDCPEVALGFFQKCGFITTKTTTQYTNGRPENIHYLENPCPDFYLQTLKEAIKTNTSNIESLKDSYSLLRLSQDKQHYQYANQQQFLNFHRNMLPQAQKQIWINCDNITNSLLNDDIVRDSLLRLAKRNAKAEIRILLEDDKKGAGNYNPTIELAQKLTSFIEIRTIQKGAKAPNEMITTVDFTAGIFRKDMTNYAGFAHYNNHLIAQRLRDKFEHHWQYAKPSMQLRRLSI